MWGPLKTRVLWLIFAQRPASPFLHSLKTPKLFHDKKSPSALPKWARVFAMKLRLAILSFVRESLNRWSLSFLSRRRRALGGMNIGSRKGFSGLLTLGFARKISGWGPLQKRTCPFRPLPPPISIFI